MGAREDSGLEVDGRGGEGESIGVEGKTIVRFIVRGRQNTTPDTRIKHLTRFQGIGRMATRTGTLMGL